MTIGSPTFKDRVREERRRSVLDAARRLFVTQGYAETTVDAIAEAAGVGKGTVYLHFATKDDLLVELITGATEGVLRQIGEIVAAGRQASNCWRCSRCSMHFHSAGTKSFREAHWSARSPRDKSVAVDT